MGDTKTFGCVLPIFVNAPHGLTPPRTPKRATLVLAFRSNASMRFGEFWNFSGVRAVGYPKTEIETMGDVRCRTRRSITSTRRSVSA